MMRLHSLGSSSNLSFRFTRRCVQYKTTICQPSKRLLSLTTFRGNCCPMWAATKTITRSYSSTRTRLTKRPFDKVLIANRGEICQRVMRTCQELGIPTVAVYSTADAQAPFVQEADEAYCLGPPAAAQSYLNTQALLHTIAETGAQAVHPGYGFLSENAAFCQQIEQCGAKWLGPPAKAIEQMGDKLASKKLAEQAGVTTVPGHELPLESLDQALQLCTEKVQYPVLLKALAGGGGKGMRVCYNELELKEAWSVSRAEAKQFFGDDRLLLEKFIEEPHHIEFQVMAAPPVDKENGQTDVVVFPERECSIQRRNQKIIEESPSVLLSEETRRDMAAQVVRMCQTVGYESAGTMEFLVDKHQNFYFLEMNTRLQVEHPVTEEACGGLSKIDLVKAMLYIGAGWGFPEEIQQMRGTDSTTHHLIAPTHHAMEARIYAEDPLRGFLPSTGPLIPYVEPITSDTLRVDSGVVAGHVVTPHYDPMLSKVIAKGTTREEAIDYLSQAMDEYVIEGVQHNARLIRAVLRNEAFLEGDTPTSFLPTQFPEGFTGVQLTPAEQMEFAVAATLIDKERRWLLEKPILAAQEDLGDDEPTTVVVRLGGFFGEPYHVRLSADGFSARAARVESLTADSDHVDYETCLDLTNLSVQLEPDRCTAQVTFGDNDSRTIQVLGETKAGELQLQMSGCDLKVLVQSYREYELSRHMQEPPVVDTSSLVQSPMPGTLISFAVSQGDVVLEGQELCIVEAMKMQNILRSPKNGTISDIRVKVGDSLMADQVILEFEQEETSD